VNLSYDLLNCYEALLFFTPASFDGYDVNLAQPLKYRHAHTVYGALQHDVDSSIARVQVLDLYRR
jgi:hypothetical protein